MLKVVEKEFANFPTDGENVTTYACSEF